MGYMEFAEGLAREAGAIMLQNFQLNMKKEWKFDHTPVTETDIAVNKMVIDRVNKHFPDHDVAGEEESNVVNNSEYLWVCDPIDGTIPFSHGVPTFTFSLALVKDGQSILGVIYDPIMDRLFSAQLGKGAFLNNKPIKVSSKDSGLVALETSHLPGLITPLRNNQLRIYKFGSTTYSGMLVACGEFAASLYIAECAHDIAALKIIVEEAGGMVTDLLGNDQRYDQNIYGAIISNGKIHDLLIKEISNELYGE